MIKKMVKIDFRLLSNMNIPWIIEDFEDYIDTIQSSRHRWLPSRGRVYIGRGTALRPTRDIQRHRT